MKRFRMRKMKFAKSKIGLGDISGHLDFRGHKKSFFIRQKEIIIMIKDTGLIGFCREKKTPTFYNYSKIRIFLRLKNVLENRHQLPLP